MNILGIADNHGSGATLVQDGKVRFAINQERFDRNKNSGAFPYDAMKAILNAAGLKPADIDLIVFASEITPSFLLRVFKPFHMSVKRKASQFSYLFNLYIVYQVLARYILKPIYKLDCRLSQMLYESRLKKLGYHCPIKMMEHHDAHAYSAFLTSPFETATVITADAMGDGVSVTVGIGKNDGTIKRLFEQSGFTALNPYYSRTTEFLGFRPNRHEGKITGLAAYGDPNVLLNLYKENLHFIGPGFSKINFCIPHTMKTGLYKKLKGKPRELVASALQCNLEQEMSKFIRYWIGKTGNKNLCLAGGIFENVKLNQRIHEIEEVENIFIFPNMSDSGLSTGAALKEAGVKPDSINDVYFGEPVTEQEMEKALADSELPFERVENVAEAVADLLAKGEVVARFDGKMEYGPRALGHRSVLTQATDPDIMDWLNGKLGRTEFMPFAPAVIEENSDDCFLGMDGARDTARFMNICFNCTDELSKTCPGVVHVDGTARPQIVHKEQDETYYEIIRIYQEKTGNKAIVNTSFNMHEEPIVRTPQDGVRAFIRSGLNYMSMGPFLVRSRSK